MEKEMTIKQKFEVLEKAKQEGATDEQLMRLCNILWPSESHSPIGPKTRKIIEDYIKSGNDEDEKKKNKGQLPIDLEVIISDLLHEMGVPAHLLGYKYLKRAIALCIKDTKVIHAVTRVMYPCIASEFETTSSRVERAIRHAIEVAWERSNTELQYKVFGYTVDSYRGKPTNIECIAMLTDHLRLQYKL